MLAQKASALQPHASAQDLSALCCTHKMSFESSLEVSSRFVDSVVTVSMQKCCVIWEKYHATWLSPACAYRSVTVCYVTVRADSPAPPGSRQQEDKLPHHCLWTWDDNSLGSVGCVAWEVHALLSLQSHTECFSPQILLHIRYPSPRTQLRHRNTGPVALPTCSPPLPVPRCTGDAPTLGHRGTSASQIQPHWSTLSATCNHGRVGYPLVDLKSPYHHKSH